jgi:hypothetical protein
MNEQQQRRYAELVQLVESHGSKMLSKHYVDEHTAMSVLCPDGHKWRPTPDRLSRCVICSKCTAKERRITPEKAAAKVAERGGRMIGTYVDTRTPFEVQCQYDHSWSTTWDRLLRGCWCRICAGCAPVDPEHVQNFVANKGGLLLSKYVNSETPLDVQCQDGHTWHPTWRSLQSGRWCADCYGNATLTTEYVQSHVANMGGLLLSEYINARTPLTVQCHIGHIWHPYWPSLKNNHWCSDCAGVAPLDPAYVRAHIEERGGKLLNEYVNVRTELIIQCHNDHTWKTFWPSIRDDGWCPECAHVAPLDPAYVKAFAAERGFTLVTEYVNARTKLLVKCQDGHVYQMYWHNIKAGHQCRYCAPNAPLTHEYVSGQITERGGILLTAYVNVRTHFQVQCQNSHIRETRWPSIHSGSWCPCCLRSKGEEKVAGVLAMLNLLAETQYHHPNVPNLRYDFFFEYNGRRYLIEFDGLQHFMFSEFFHRSPDKFIDSQIRDRIKTQVAMMMDYTLIRIDYSEIDNVESFIRSTLDSGMTGLITTNGSLYSYLTHPTETIPRSMGDYYVRGLTLVN